MNTKTTFSPFSIINYILCLDCSGCQKYLRENSQCSFEPNPCPINPSMTGLKNKEINDFPIKENLWIIILVMALEVFLLGQTLNVSFMSLLDWKIWSWKHHNDPFNLTNALMIPSFTFLRSVTQLCQAYRFIMLCLSLDLNPIGFFVQLMKILCFALGLSFFLNSSSSL